MQDSNSNTKAYISPLRNQNDQVGGWLKHDIWPSTLSERGHPQDPSEWRGKEILWGADQQGRLQVLQVCLQGRRNGGGAGFPYFFVLTKSYCECRALFQLWMWRMEPSLWRWHRFSLSRTPTRMQSTYGRRIRAGAQISNDWQAIAKLKPLSLFISLFWSILQCSK